MRYHIVYKRVRIASFLHEADRNIALNALVEYFPDCEFALEND